MGDNVSVEEQKTFDDKLQFVQLANDKNFGEFSVFRFKEPPYEYIMDHTKTFIQGDTRLSGYAEFLQLLKAKDHKNLAKIHLIDVRKEIHMCIKDTKVHTFCNYYNFTFKQAIDKMKTKQLRFTQPELTYILGCLLECAMCLKQSGHVLGDYRSERIYLSPEGYVKIYTIQIQQTNKHTAYYKALVDRSTIDEMILAPEQLNYISKMQSQPNIDIFKADLFAIGMIILQLMTLDSTKFYYTEDKNSLKMSKISHNLSSFSSEYSAQFIDILRGCLMENPRQRSTIVDTLRRVQQFRKKSTNVSYCIRLNDQSENAKKKPVVSTKGQYILAGIQKRLTPSPIATMNSSTSSGFYSRHATQSYEDSAKQKLYRHS